MRAIVRQRSRSQARRASEGSAARTGAGGIRPAAGRAGSKTPRAPDPCCAGAVESWLVESSAAVKVDNGIAHQVNVFSGKREIEGEHQQTFEETLGKRKRNPE